VSSKKIIGRGPALWPSQIPFTPRAKGEFLELSLERRHGQLGHNYNLGTEHLLLGLFVKAEGVAARVLENLGVDLCKGRTQGDSDARRKRRSLAAGRRRQGSHQNFQPRLNWQQPHPVWLLRQA